MTFNTVYIIKCDNCGRTEMTNSLKQIPDEWTESLVKKHNEFAHACPLKKCKEWITNYDRINK